VHLVRRLRTIAVTTAAVAAGVVHSIMHAREEQQVELKPGDAAPEFELAGSDGRTYRLKDLAGRPVVLAWFPKAFTGG
jgi:peroxiredoxin